MKDRRFLELVNLYLDGEISESEMGELEREIRSSAGRMDQYRRYCRMQKACMMLAEQHREMVPGTQGKIVHLPEARRGWLLGQWWRGGIYAGTAALAATVILVIGMSGPSATDSQVAKSGQPVGTKVVQIPVGEFSPKPKYESRFASLRERWNNLSHVETVSIPASLKTVHTPEFNQTPVITEWPASIFPSNTPLEFRYGTDVLSGATVLHGHPAAPAKEGEVEFTNFQFER